MADWGVTPGAGRRLPDARRRQRGQRARACRASAPKTAAKLLQKYGTLDNLLAHVDEIKQPKLQGEPQGGDRVGRPGEVPASWCASTTNVPMPLDWEGWRLRSRGTGRSCWRCSRSSASAGFANRVRGPSKAAGPAKNAERAGRRRGAAGRSPAAARATCSPANAVDDVTAPTSSPFGGQRRRRADDRRLEDRRTRSSIRPKAFKDFLKQLKKQKRFAFDLETTGLDPLRADIVGYAFSLEGRRRRTTSPVRGPGEDAEARPGRDARRPCKPILEDPAVAKVNQNIKYDLIVLRPHGVELAGVAGDSMVAHYLLHSGERTPRPRRPDPQATSATRTSRSPS